MAIIRKTLLSSNKLNLISKYFSSVNQFEPTATSSVFFSTASRFKIRGKKMTESFIHSKEKSRQIYVFYCVELIFLADHTAYFDSLRVKTIETKTKTKPRMM